MNIGAGIVEHHECFCLCVLAVLYLQIVRLQVALGFAASWTLYCGRLG